MFISLKVRNYKYLSFLMSSFSAQPLGISSLSTPGRRRPYAKAPEPVAADQGACAFLIFEQRFLCAALFLLIPINKIFASKCFWHVFFNRSCKRNNQHHHNKNQRKAADNTSCLQRFKPAKKHKHKRWSG